ncbi:MAG: DNA gyrase subunit A [Candidatus Zambryskibacteria bacterium CG10_big_fil_rev_8_21_14_0_10_42_12]|uniref:DNA gyrase subunit A n=1 Tax=Candidatus Zambryskibacteria bacterium CG10_big_fil_rev_8_21_14_0_10_42_12 TaxID=1975115 RepID=A0A2H0QW86_9BACT|nr:MAG: DNA gyrase subunit A [Candidatus Zambryskibacteria bacterium CG10_big_fil_rev_8_21_14_0_10_42_12]
MAKKNEEYNPEGEGLIEASRVISQSIVDEMKASFIDYAMSVITDRALPDVRDGLKPVHRRILFAMQEMNLTSSAKTKKSAAVVGEVLGKYHPHGDTSVYDAMVKMAQPFTMRYPLVIGQGNFGSVDGDSPAAMRYTEAKMSKLAGELLRDIEKKTVDTRPNYDGTKREPVVLPTAVPNLLLNGGLGIAVGMATNIPPHNLTEVLDATTHLVDNPDASSEDLMQFIKGPDFPTGGVIFNEKDIHHAYSTGRGGIVARGVADIVETKGGMFQIVISAIPYRVNKQDMVIKIADLVREKKLEGIKGLRDESTKDIRVVIDLKTGAQPQKVLNYLYKHTQLEDTFHLNLVALVDGVPKTLSVKGVLEEFVGHRKEVIRRRTEYDLEKALDREHILIGLKKALDHIDEIIALIKKSKDVETARAGLIKTFKFSERQANAILEMRLQKLSGLERKKIEDELKSVQALIKELKSILESPKKVIQIIKDELGEIKEKYGDERQTKVMKGGVKNISVEDMIPDVENVLVMTAGGYIKRTNPEEFKRQKRGGVGVIDLNTKEEDFVTRLISAGTHDNVLFFTDKGKVYQIKMYELPEGKRATKGKSVMNFLPLAQDEHITSVLPVSKEEKAQKDMSIIMVTEDGTSKRVSADAFSDVRTSGIIAIKLAPNDRLIAASLLAEKDSVLVTTQKGQSIHFKANDIREMGRTAGGVRSIKLGKGDKVIAAQVAPAGMKDATLLIVTKNGYGKKTLLKEYKIQKRGGSGIKTVKLTSKTGDLIASMIITDPETEVVAMSTKGQVIRTGVDEIAQLGRQTQGVRVMKLREGDAIASFTCL